MTRRVCFALDLVDDAELIAEYERAHAAGAVWRGVTAAIRATGFTAMEIWRAGDRLFMIAEVEADWPRPLPPELVDENARWEAAMDRFQRRLPVAAADEKWVELTRIYSLDEQ